MRNLLIQLILLSPFENFLFSDFSFEIKSHHLKVEHVKNSFEFLLVPFNLKMEIKVTKISFISS